MSIGALPCTHRMGGSSCILRTVRSLFEIKERTVQLKPISCWSRGMMTRFTRRAAMPRLGAAVFATAFSARAASSTSAAQATPIPGMAGYLVTRRYRLKPAATYEELTRRVNEGFVPIIREVPGFIEYFLVEPEDDTHLAVSIFADQAGADESTQRARGWAEEAVAELVELPAFEVVSGPVRLDARPG
jgi:quinol monooxygenase YgiN